MNPRSLPVYCLIIYLMYYQGMCCVVSRCSGRWIKANSSSSPTPTTTGYIYILYTVYIFSLSLISYIHIYISMPAGCSNPSHLNYDAVSWMWVLLLMLTKASIVRLLHHSSSCQARRGVSYNNGK